MSLARLQTGWSVAAATLVLHLLAPVDSPAAVHRLSAGQAFSFVELAFTEPTVTPDGRYIVYSQNAELADTFELWSAPLAGGAPVRISRPLPANGDVYSFRLSPDGSRAVYVGNQPGPAQLLATAVDGSTAAYLLASALTAVGSIEFSPDGKTVVYIADGQVSGRYELFIVPVTGGNPARINGPLVAGGNVTDFAISPDGANIVYRADQGEDEDFALYGTPIAGGGTWWEISSRPPDSHHEPNVGSFAISTSGRVVYIQEHLADDRFELFSTPIGGGVTARLNDTPVENGDVLAFKISPDGSHAVYLADQEVDSRLELYSVPVDDGDVVKLNGPLAAGGEVWRDFLISPDSSRVVYVADEAVDERYELYSVPTSGGTRIRLNEDQGPFVDVFLDPLVTPDSSRVVYRTGSGWFALSLLSVPITGGEPDRLVDIGAISALFWHIQSPALAGDGAHVFFELEFFPPSETTLYRVPIVGGQILRAGPTLHAAGERFLWTKPAGDPRQILFVANPGAERQTELYLGDICVFCDGFESGETVRWSAVVVK